MSGFRYNAHISIKGKPPGKENANKKKGSEPVIKTVSTGRYKGHRVSDVTDVVWSLGFKLPRLFKKKGATLKDMAMQAISQGRVIIDQLPAALRREVNQHHKNFGIGIITNPELFKSSCWRHIELGTKEKCRQCRARREAWELLMLKNKGSHITEGLLMSKNKERCTVKAQREMRGVTRKVRESKELN